jgi:methionyl aminopeptidase
MSIESRADLVAMQKIGSIVAQVLRAMKAEVIPGKTTAEVDRVGAETMKRNDARSAPQIQYGYPAATCISVNDEIVHGIPGDRRLQPGDIVTVDVAAELDGYIADAAVTVVAGKATPLNERLIGCAQRAFAKSMRFARADRPIRRLGQAIERQVRSEGFYVLHELTGHGVGRDLHEEPTVPNYGPIGMRDRFTEGLVVTVEPIISVGTNRFYELADGWTTKTVDGSFAAHHEHTIVITNGKPIILTSAA